MEYRNSLKERNTRSARSILKIRRILKPRLITASDGRIETKSTIAIGENGYLKNDLVDGSEYL